jgi:hypothetical protein
MYNGDRTKWLKFAYGLMAINLNHYTNKASYDPDAVIEAVDKSFASNSDDPLLTYPNTQNDDINVWGRTRGNLTSTTLNARQTEFVVNLMNGSSFTGVVDPRMSRMLAPSPDGVYRGLDVDVIGFGALTATQQPNNLHGYPGTGGLQQPGRYLFDDKAKITAQGHLGAHRLRQRQKQRQQPVAHADHDGGEDGVSRRYEHRPHPGQPDAQPHHDPEVHRAVGLGA